MVACFFKLGNKSLLVLRFKEKAASTFDGAALSRLFRIAVPVMQGDNN